MLHRRIKDGDAQDVTSVTKPAVTDAQKEQRLAFCRGHIDTRTLTFVGMYHTIHLDENLFYVTENRKSFVVLPDERVPTQSVRNKCFIGEVMMLAAVARPWWCAGTDTFFDDRIGVCPFLRYEAAKRTSRNRFAGTMVARDVAVTRDWYRDMFISKVLPAIARRWQDRACVLQQDNASALIAFDDVEFAVAAAAAASGVQVALSFQPTQSPNMNILDLSLFNAMQALQRNTTTRNIEELVAAVTSAY